MNIKIKMDLKYSDSVLKEAGYEEHMTIYKGEHKKGYIKHGYANKRFHAFVFDKHIEIHIDKTINGKHKVMNNSRYKTYLEKESKKIRKIYQKYNSKPLKEKRLLKDEYAPNVMELQKLKLNSHITKLSFFSRLCKFFSQFKS